MRGPNDLSDMRADWNFQPGFGLVTATGGMPHGGPAGTIQEPLCEPLLLSPYPASHC